jgi:hypothetical protein
MRSRVNFQDLDFDWVFNHSHQKVNIELFGFCFGLICDLRLFGVVVGIAIDVAYGQWGGLLVFLHELLNVVHGWCVVIL